ISVLLGPTRTAASTFSAKAISSRGVGEEVASIPERPRAICSPAEPGCRDLLRHSKRARRLFDESGPSDKRIPPARSAKLPIAPYVLAGSHGGKLGPGMAQFRYGAIKRLRPTDSVLFGSLCNAERATQAKMADRATSEFETTRERSGDAARLSGIGFA